jgi:hypothetical protein
MVPVQTPVLPLSLPSSRFCFDTSSFLSPCDCHNIARCIVNPCLLSSCSSYPEAQCYIDFCLECKAVWYLDGKKVNCRDDRGKYAMTIIDQLQTCSVWEFAFRKILLFPQWDWVCHQGDFHGCFIIRHIHIFFAYFWLSNSNISISSAENTPYFLYLM